MSSPQSAELKLKIIDTIASTIANFIEHDGSPGAVDENKRLAEDVAEYVAEFIGLSVSADMQDQGTIVATMSRTPRVNAEQ